MINLEKEIGGKMLTLQTGKIARQSAGSVVLTYGETVLLVAVNAAKEAREDVGFFHSRSNTVKNIMLVEKSLAGFSKERLDQQRERFFLVG